VSWSIEDGATSPGGGGCGVGHGDTTVRMGHRRDCSLAIVQARRRRKYEQKDHKRKLSFVYQRVVQ